MIDRFKNFLKRKNKNEFDSKSAKDIINDIVTPLEDINGVTINISQGNVIQSDSKLFLVKYNFHLTSDVDLEEFKNEILNCKSHIESEDLVMYLSISTRKNGKNISYAGRINIYTNDSFKNYRLQSYNFQNIINFLNFLKISNDIFSNIKNKYSIENHISGLDDMIYVQITKGIRDGVEIPYNFIEVKDNVLTFLDMIKKHNLIFRLAFVSENNTGGFSSEEPSYDDIKNGLYDKRQVSILTIYEQTILTS